VTCACALGLALVVGLLIPISFGLIAVVRRSFVRPLELLAAAGARFARGETPAPLTFADGDELDAVARSFNEMVHARTQAMLERERQLTEAETEVKTLQGILPICAQCKRIRNETCGWEQRESLRMRRDPTRIFSPHPPSKSRASPLTDLPT
jgi:nitrate/nitrite-specific signal transduction histidine kinase